MIRRVRKKRKWLRNSLLSLFLVAVITVGFSIYQFKSGVMESSNELHQENNNYEFHALEPQFGEINMLLIGNDSRGEEHSRSDTLMIAHYNLISNKIKLASIMRDTYVDIPGHGYQKINAAFAFGGPELVRQTIKENFDVDINYYAIVDFEGFTKIVDVVAPDGVEVEIPYEMSYGIGTVLEPGTQVLHGNDLLGYVRFRHDRLSDFGRVERQQEVISKLKEQAVSIENLYNLPKIIGRTASYVDTNLDTQSILSISKGLITNKSQAVESIRIPIQHSFENDTVDVGAVLKADLDMNKEALKSFLET
jgi:polyisoprenyl-teichoic acid--peptidoglycan teichoic acid transferase